MLSAIRKSAWSARAAGVAVLGLAAGLPISMSQERTKADGGSSETHKVLIVGGGTAGTTVANQIKRKVR